MAGRKRRYRVLRTIRPNVGVEAQYRDELDALIREMQHSVTYWVGARYRSVEDDLAFDALPFPTLKRALDKVTERWRRNFYERAGELALKFVKHNQKHTDTSFQKSLKDAGVTFEFKSTAGMKTALQASVFENVQLIKSIADQNLSEVNQIVTRAVQSGGAWGGVQEELQERYGITRRRANLIVRDQASKATSAFNRQRQLDMGLFEAQWVHSSGGKNPRPSHVKAGRDRLVYDVREGAFLDGKHTWPGHEINCRCCSRPVLPF